MAAIHTWAFLFLWIRTSTQDVTPDVQVTCVFSAECVLPCSFPPAGGEVISWYRQDALVYNLSRGGRSSGVHQHAGRTAVLAQLVSHGNASLRISGCGPRDRGRYRCEVRTSAGVHEAHVTVRVEAPIRSVTLELSSLSGYKEMKCFTHEVYPAPHVTWTTDPPTSGALRPITRKLADRRGLYAVESRLRRLKDQSELTFICQINSSYGTQVWTASLRERVISGVEGRDLTIPCHAPPYLDSPALSWSFTSHNEPVPILAYDSLSQRSSASAPWEGRVRLDALKARSGDGSLRLVDPNSLEHTGVYVCVYSSLRNTHTEHTRVNISAVTGERSHQADEGSHLWIVAVVIAVLALTLVGVWGFRRLRGSQSQPTKTTEESSEMQPVRADVPAQTGLREDCPLTLEDTSA